MMNVPNSLIIDYPKKKKKSKLKPIIYELHPNPIKTSLPNSPNWFI